MDERKAEPPSVRPSAPAPPVRALPAGDERPEPPGPRELLRATVAWVYWVSALSFLAFLVVGTAWFLITGD